VHIVGIHSSFNSKSHDSGVCLISENQVRYVLEEERFSRNKSSVGYPPQRSLQYLIKQNNLCIEDIELIASDGVTFPNMSNKLSEWLAIHFQCKAQEVRDKIVLYSQSDVHALGSFLSSGFNEAITIDIEGVGDNVSTKVVRCSLLNGSLSARTLYETGFEESLGIFYGIFTQFLGFDILEGEYKVMGMAAYGDPTIDLQNLIDVEKGQVKSNFMRFLLPTANSTVNEPIVDFEALSRFLGVLPRYPSMPFTQSHFNLARSVQDTFENCLLKLVEYWTSFTGISNLCLSGGCALNALANMKLLPKVSALYVMPASSDRGLPLGAALLGNIEISGRAATSGEIQKLSSQSYPTPRVSNMFLGRDFSSKSIELTLKQNGIKFKRIVDAAQHAAYSLAEGKVIGWHCGRSEYGPRALGNRSILASPRMPGMKDVLNERIKFREEFRPFAPVIYDPHKLLNIPRNHDSSSMTTTVYVEEQDRINFPEAVHFDNTSRIQLLDNSSNSSVLRVLQELLKLEHPSLINTSFNLKGEPIVDSPSDAIRTFFSSGIDYLYLSDFLIKK